jgi:hypothetical protein
VEDFGRDQVQPKEFFQLNCETELKKRFPFPEPNLGICEVVRAPLKEMAIFPNVGDLKLFKSTVEAHYQACVNQEESKMPSPSAWSVACKLSAGRFATQFDQQKVYLAAQVGDLMSGGCILPGGTVGAQGIKLQCSNYPVYQACLAILQHGAEKQHCQLDQEAADKKLISFLMAALGNKRCAVSGKDVMCGRPWKIDTCKTLLAQVAGPLAGSSQVQCKGNTTALADFGVKSQQAKETVAALNAAVRDEDGKPDGSHGRGPYGTLSTDVGSARDQLRVCPPGGTSRDQPGGLPGGSQQGWC